MKWDWHLKLSGVKVCVVHKFRPFTTDPIAHTYTCTLSRDRAKYILVAYNLWRTTSKCPRNPATAVSKYMPHNCVNKWLLMKNGHFTADRFCLKGDSNVCVRSTWWSTILRICLTVNTKGERLKVSLSVSVFIQVRPFKARTLGSNSTANGAQNVPYGTKTSYVAWICAHVGTTETKHVIPEGMFTVFSVLCANCHLLWFCRICDLIVARGLTGLTLTINKSRYLP